MGGKYISRFEKDLRYEKSKKLEAAARGNKKNVFVRVRKMSLYDIMTSIMVRKGLTAAMEIRNYVQTADKDSVSKQAWLKARQNLNPEVFRLRNDYYMKNFYESKNEVKLWKDYLVLAIDGSKAEIPNSEENREYYGTQGNASCSGPARALLSGLFDVLNDFFLDLQICNVNKSELKAAEENIKSIERIGLQQKILIIFDRGYPSLELMNYLETHKIAYIIRISSSIFKKEREKLGEKGGCIEIEHTKKRLRNLMKSNNELYQIAKTKEGISTRFVVDKTPAGEEFAVLTNLSEQITDKEIVDAYFFRWKIEEAYHTLKNKMKFESVTGMASIYVEQDFLAQVFVYNMMEDVRHSAEEKIQKKADKYKYPQRINQNIAIGIFKNELLELMLEENINLRTRKLKNLQIEIEKYTLPVRKSKSQKRQFNKANKYACNLKPSF